MPAYSNQLEQQLEKLIKQQEKDLANAQMEVGYTADYAAYVHEKVEMKWQGIPRQSGINDYWDAKAARFGTAKFLEHPVRASKKWMPQFIKDTMQNTNEPASFTRAITLAAIRIRQESRFIVPYEYGDLHESAYAKNIMTGRQYA